MFGYTFSLECLHTFIDDAAIEEKRFRLTPSLNRAFSARFSVVVLENAAPPIHRSDCVSVAIVELIDASNV